MESPSPTAAGPRRRWWPWLAAAAVLVGLGLGLFLAWRPPARPEAAAASPTAVADFRAVPSALPTQVSPATALPEPTTRSTASPPRRLTGWPADRPALTPPAMDELVTSARPPLANRLGAPGAAPAEEPALVLGLLDHYRHLFGGYPAGAEGRHFVNALRGRNPDRLPLLPPDHPRLAPTGELLDAWGRPFVFHLRERRAIEVRSAGPDGELFTADDLVAATAQATPPMAR